MEGVQCSNCMGYQEGALLEGVRDSDSQRILCICEVASGSTNNINDNEFPTLDDFEQKVMSWQSLPEKVIYKIIDKEPIGTKFGQGLMLTLLDRKGNTTYVWATSIIKSKLESEKFSGKNAKIFIVSYGKKVSGLTKNNYYDFKIMKK